MRKNQSGDWVGYSSEFTPTKRPAGAFVGQRFYVVDLGQTWLWTGSDASEGWKRIQGGYEPMDDMLKVKSIQQRWRDSFKTLTAWDRTDYGTGLTATLSAGVLTIAMNTTAGAGIELVSKAVFTTPFKAMFGFNISQRIVNNVIFLEAVSCDENGVLDCLHGAAIRMDNTTAANAIHEVQNGGLMPYSPAAAAFGLGVGSYYIGELELDADDVWFHSRVCDSAASRAASVVRHQQIPDPNSYYKLRIRALNVSNTHVAVTNAIAGTGNVIRLTATAHGCSTSDKVWVECLNGITNNGAMVRGFYTVTVVDVNTLELQGTTFSGAYVTGTGRIFRAVAPATNTNVLFQFASCMDYTELTAEVTASRGSASAAQALPIYAAGGSVTATAAGQTAHDGVISGSPVRIGARAITSNYAAVASGDAADLISTLVGALITKPYAIPELDWSYGSSTAVINTSDVALKAAGAAGIRNYLTGLQLMNSNATGTAVVVKDGASTVIWAGYLPANMTAPLVVQFATPLKGTAATAMNFACLTTAAAVYVSAQGYQAP
ncbi:MAG TPA: hypothetical protein VNT26_07340 [Candidatus Sulfotelmatobacter sp.]|nr:hypothetical protein [Candidatus Sulfotelmatobacter sp.]